MRSTIHILIMKQNQLKIKNYHFIIIVMLNIQYGLLSNVLKIILYWNIIIWFYCLDKIIKVYET